MLTVPYVLADEREVHALSIRLNLTRPEGATARGRAQARSEKARAATCAVLGRYLGVPGAQVQLTTGPYGKPRLAEPSPLRFNLSHSGDLLVIALALGIDVGVDVEHIRPMPRALNLARRFFRPEEAEALERVQTDMLDRTFFHCWTQKEAYLKALGLGLQADLQSFRVRCELPAPAALEWISDDDAACWSMHIWEPTAEYTAALAVRDREKRLRLFPLLEGTLL